MREICTYGSVRGVAGDRHPYRDPLIEYVRLMVVRCGDPGFPRKLGSFLIAISDQQGRPLGLVRLWKGVLYFVLADG